MNENKTDAPEHYRYQIDTCSNGYILTVRAAGSGHHIDKSVFANLSDVFGFVDIMESEQGRVK